MKSFAHKLRTITGVQYAALLEYRAEMVLWVAGTVLPFILMGVWMTASAKADLVLQPVEMARYFFATFVVRNMTLVWVVWEFEQQVVKGTLSHWLLQPMDPVWRHFAEHLAERFVRLPILVVIGVVFFAVYPDALWTPGLWDIPIALAAIVLTFIMRFSVQYTFAMLSFWTERAHAIEQLWALPYLFLSGMVAPLALYPQAVQQVLVYTPFPYLIWYPAQKVLGLPTAAGSVEVTLGMAVGVMAFWTLVFILANRLLWRIGIRRYSAMGA